MYLSIVLGCPERCLAMNPESILFPMAALVALTFAVLLVIPYKRFKAGREGLVTARDFKYGESANVPPDVSIPNRNLMNLLEMPVLFYVACVTLYVTKRVDATLVGLAWIYVGTRVAHSAVHLTYNRVRDRLAAYVASNIVLAMIWLRLFHALLNGPG
jgi:hypothetical protein